MAIDVRTSRSGNYNRCKWYKAIYIKGNKLISDAIAEGVFYSNDTSNIKNRVNVANGVLTDNVALTISTQDYVGGMSPDDVVEIDGELFIVVSLDVKPHGRSEQFNRRVAAETIITLRA